MFAFVFLLCQIFLFNISQQSEIKVDPSKSMAWGPGLSPDKLVFPARYFFVQLFDETGDKITEAPDGELDVHISGPTKSQNCRVWSNILNRRDGSYIVRYKVYHTCEGLKIDLRYNNFPIHGFPMTFSGYVYADDCTCPQNIDRWLRDMKCETSYPQIDENLSKFPAVKFQEAKKKILKKFTNSGSMSLCHYVVKKNSIYRKCYGEYVGFKIFMDAILLSLTRKVFLPDLEFFVNLGDWPLVKKNQEVLPIFSWCGSEETIDIIMPTYDLTEATLECMGRVQLDMLSVQGNTGPEWTNKISKGFWRGRDSRQERLDLIDLARKHPDMINASLTNFFFFRDKEKQYGPKEKHISFFDFFQYKYQINIDGTVAAYRLPYLLAGNSVVLKQESPYFEHFYKDLLPGIHYVPFKRDLSDLIEKIEWLRDNDEAARNISKQAQDFTRDNLMPKDIFCYYTVLLRDWSVRLVDSPRVRDDMEPVQQINPEVPCTCKHIPEKDEL
ncbi:UNVERIFIED_CONTAM: hypothetical protein PYX00_006622 [Menopon gallinae]|uniref:Glycosyl transferase CAP10 domain-containing protein n=1 Tax=Menopon gallinae TaxID=328185 RepID=A0AAW2HWX9_9NEOP